MLSTLIALPYELARLPIVVIDNSLSGRLAETSGTRVTLDRVIGSADKFAGALLRNRGIAVRGADRLKRSEMLLTAARLEQQAADQREQAQKAAASGRRKATQQRKTAQDRAVSGLGEADATEKRAKAAASKRATKAAATRKASADQRAADRAATAEKRKARLDASADGRLGAAQREANKELKDVRETKKSAAEARADAERLSDLAKAKKQERKQS